MSKPIVNELSKLAEMFGVNEGCGDSDVFHAAMPLINRIRKDGASFFLKADGERDSNVYTLMISGGVLKDDYLRVETSDLSQGLFDIISEYQHLVWGVG